MRASDEHGPLTGCNLRQCGLDDPYECPFVDLEREPVVLADSHRHEYRQLVNVDGLQFYCIHCLTVQVETKN